MENTLYCLSVISWYLKRVDEFAPLFVILLNLKFRGFNMLYYLKYIDEEDCPQSVYYDKNNFMEMLNNSAISISNAKTNDPAYKEDKFVEFDENLRLSPLREEYNKSTR